MAANIKTFPLIEATSSLGEQFARRFQLSARNPDVAAYQCDTTDLAALSSHTMQILTEQAAIDCVFVVSEDVGTVFTFLESSSSTESGIVAQCNTNVTAQMLLTRIFMPHFSAVAAICQPATFLLMAAGLGFIPIGFFPVYSVTKAAIHSLALALRQQINQAKDEKVKRNLGVVEVVQPFVASEDIEAFLGSPGPQPIPLKEYIDDIMATLSELSEEGKSATEVASGSAQIRVEVWRGSIGKHMKRMGLEC